MKTKILTAFLFLIVASTQALAARPSINELNTRVNQLEAENNAQQSEIDDLDIRVTDLETGGIKCNQGDIVQCYTGAPTIIGVGECKSGFRACLNGGVWGGCEGEVLPQPEICNDLIDNDCDGMSDCNDAECVNNQICQLQQCDPLIQDCPSGTDACYIVPQTDSASNCAPPSIEPGNESPGLQGDICTFINTCEKGYSCTGTTPDLQALACAYNCDATGLGGPACGDAGGPGSGYTCIAFSDIWSVTAPNEWGACINCADFPGGTFPGCE